MTNSSSSSFVVIGRKVKINDVKLNSEYTYIMLGEYNEGQDLFYIDNKDTLDLLKSIPYERWKSNFSIWEVLAEGYEDIKEINQDKIKKWITEGKKIFFLSTEVSQNSPLDDIEYFELVYLGIDREEEKRQVEEKAEYERLKAIYEPQKKGKRNG